jgi:hypothetical protein
MDPLPRHVQSATFAEFTELRQRTAAAVASLNRREPDFESWYLRQLREAQSFEETFVLIFARRLQILIQRQRKYGPNNIRQQGIFGVLTRIREDKLSRISQALNGRIENGTVVLDPIPEGDSEDTWLDGTRDVGNYAAILEAVNLDVWGKPLEEELQEPVEVSDTFHTMAVALNEDGGSDA